MASTKRYSLMKEKSFSFALELSKLNATIPLQKNTTWKFPEVNCPRKNSSSNEDRSKAREYRLFRQRWTSSTRFSPPCPIQKHTHFTDSIVSGLQQMTNLSSWHLIIMCDFFSFYLIGNTGLNSSGTFRILFHCQTSSVWSII